MLAVWLNDDEEDDVLRNVSDQEGLSFFLYARNFLIVLFTKTQQMVTFYFLAKFLFLQDRPRAALVCHSLRAYLTARCCRPRVVCSRIR